MGYTWGDIQRWETGAPEDDTSEPDVRHDSLTDGGVMKVRFLHPDGAESVTEMQNVPRATEMIETGLTAFYVRYVIWHLGSHEEAATVILGEFSDPEGVLAEYLPQAEDEPTS